MLFSYNITETSSDKKLEKFSSGEQLLLLPPPKKQLSQKTPDINFQALP